MRFPAPAWRNEQGASDTFWGVPLAFYARFEDDLAIKAIQRAADKFTPAEHSRAASGEAHYAQERSAIRSAIVVELERMAESREKYTERYGKTGKAYATTVMLEPVSGAPPSEHALVTWLNNEVRKVQKRAFT